MNAHINQRHRAPAIILPKTDRPIFASANEMTDIAGLSRQFDGYHASTMAAQQKTNAEIQKISAEVDKIVEKQAALAFSGGGDRGDGNLRNELKAIGLFARNGDDSELRKISASMSVGSESDGGYFVTPALSQTMTKKLFDQTAMRRLARVETITAGDSWEEPIDSGDSEAVWVGEKTARPATGTPKIGKLRVPVPELYALQPVTQRLLDDSGFDLGAWLEGKVTDKFGRTEGQAFISGDGVEKPFGFLSNPIVAMSDSERDWGSLQYVPTGDASSFKALNVNSGVNPADVIKDLTWKLRAPYRSGASFLMNSNTASIIDKFKNNQGDYIWRTGMQAGSPPTLLNYPVEFDETMPDVGANSHPIAFGNFKLGYVIVDKVGIRLLRDPFTDKPNVLFYFYKRVGGGVANSEAIKLLKCAAS